MTCFTKHDSACPFAMTDQSELVQNYGCLPTPQEIIIMRVKHEKSWACHDDPNKPCIGAIKHLKAQGHPHKVTELVTELDPWHLYVK